MLNCKSQAPASRKEGAGSRQNAFYRFVVALCILELNVHINTSEDATPICSINNRSFAILRACDTQNHSYTQLCQQ